MLKRLWDLGGGEDCGNDSGGTGVGERSAYELVRKSFVSKDSHETKERIALSRKKMEECVNEGTRKEGRWQHHSHKLGPINPTRILKKIRPLSEV